MAAIAASSSSKFACDGPVLSLINKRLRALRKKLNRISQMEDSVSRGKSLNKEQKETLRSKAFVLAGIDELERLREPLMQAVIQEIQIALEENKQILETPSEESTTEEGNGERGSSDERDVSAVTDLLNLVYFGSIFDVCTVSMMHDSNLLIKMHERNCCITYDYVTDDEAAGDPLNEWDLDLIGMMKNLLISRPVHSKMSHKDSLKMCVEHAKLWLSNSEQPIEPTSNITYAGLKQKLNKIVASDYFTTTLEIMDPVEVAAAAEDYAAIQDPLHGSMIPQADFNFMEDSTAEFEQEVESYLYQSHNRVVGQGRWF